MANSSSRARELGLSSNGSVMGGWSSFSAGSVIEASGVHVVVSVRAWVLCRVSCADRIEVALDSSSCSVSFSTEAVASCSAHHASAIISSCSAICESGAVDEVERGGISV